MAAFAGAQRDAEVGAAGGDEEAGADDGGAVRPDHILAGGVWLARPRPEVFDFFADAANLPRVQPAWARPRWIAPPPPRLAAGTVLDFRVPGFPVAWRVMIREFDPPHRFVDVQLRGPFARWEHRHRFVEGPRHDEPAAGPGTRVWG